MEGQSPDVRVVRLGERGARADGGGGDGGGRGEVPVEEGAFGAAGDEDRMDRVPGDGAHLFFVALEDPEFFHGPDVKNADGLVSGGAGNEIAIWGPGESLDCVLVLVTRAC